MTVWDDAHPAPAGGAEFEKKLLRWWSDDAQAQMAKSAEEFEKIARPAWRTLIGRADGKVVLMTNKPGADPQKGVLLNFGEGGVNPVIRLGEFGKRIVLWIDARGKAALFNEGGAPRAEITRLINGGSKVFGFDLFRQGAIENPVVANPREAPAYTYGYNPAIFAQRAHDVLGALRFARGTEPWSSVVIVAVGDAGPLAAAALALDPSAADAAVIDTGAFRFENVAGWRDLNFLPAAAKYGDLPAHSRSPHRARFI